MIFQQKIFYSRSKNLVSTQKHNCLWRVKHPGVTYLSERACCAFCMVVICWATTDNTSMSILLNSSKHAQAPELKNNSMYVQWSTKLINLLFLCADKYHETTKMKKMDPKSTNNIAEFIALRAGQSICFLPFNDKIPFTRILEF